MSTDGPGTLYLCATPIGNLGDMTIRAVETLRSVDLIAAEDTRHSRKLTSHFDIHVPLTSYHEHNRRTKGPELLDKLLAGKNIALVSDAGLPGISDPGEDLVRLAIDAGVRVHGATVHFVDEGMDFGPIILQEAVPVETEDTVATLSERILHLEHRLYVRAIRLYCEGRISIDGRAVKILPPRQKPKEEGELH